MLGKNRISSRAQSLVPIPMKIIYMFFAFIKKIAETLTHITILNCLCDVLYMVHGTWYMVHGT
jgi:hypothetical protein